MCFQCSSFSFSFRICDDTTMLFYTLISNLVDQFRHVWFFIITKCITLQKHITKISLNLIQQHEILMKVTHDLVVVWDSVDLFIFIIHSKSYRVLNPNKSSRVQKKLN